LLRARTKAACRYSSSPGGGPPGWRFSLYPVTPDILEPAVKAALDEGGFGRARSVRELPGMTRAVARTLRHAWNADIDLAQYCRAPRRGRLSEPRRHRASCEAADSSAVMLPRDIRAAALDQAHRARRCARPCGGIERLSWIARSGVPC